MSFKWICVALMIWMAAPIMAKDGIDHKALPNEIWAFHFESGGNAFGGDDYYLCATGQYIYRSHSVLFNRKNAVYTGTYIYDTANDSVQFLTYALKIDHPDRVLMIAPATIPKPLQTLRFAEIIERFQDDSKVTDGIKVYYKNTGVMRPSGTIDPLFHESFSRYPMQQSDIEASCEPNFQS